MKRLTRYLWPIALCMSVGFSASLFQREAIAEWYPFLNTRTHPSQWSVPYRMGHPLHPDRNLLRTNLGQRPESIPT